MSSVIHRKGQRESKVDARTIRDDEIESAFVVPPGTVQSAEPAEPDAAVEFTGRNVVIPDHYRVHVRDKLARLERFDPGIFRFDVRLSHERNRRLSKVCQQVELTAKGKGPVVRGQASGENFYAALESAVSKLESGLRRVKDRRRVSRGSRTPISVAAATEELA
ncbi:MAG TPA: ribosome-associated translation inhibitor RaiA, partial [Gordonia sp. (in: high G+C Gram-positive bacteria)]|nr:ribosome-associated translation inhibitor RaiA [Gordonia sp. (in: high G+C Gram-positive bacteria)]